MDTLKVALLQIKSHGLDQQANLEKGLDWVKKAKALHADIALFPEMWNIGYTPFDPVVWTEQYDPLDPKWKKEIAHWQKNAITCESKFIRSFCNLAKELKIAIVITYLESWPEAPRNSASLINQNGEIVLTYAKVHTCDFSFEASLTPGNSFQVCDLDTKVSNIKIGIMICYDREFPESSRILMLNGAEIILVPNSCEIEQNRLTQFRARSFENMVGLAMANYANETSLGKSVAYSPVAFDKGGSRDTTLVMANENEGIWIAEFNLDEIRNYRKRETWGNSFRKPSVYGKLISKEVLEPFVRKLSRR
ncbi:MAG: carbon-nitrogen hydrolase family protein [Deltaproteobacteria bacterium]|nr:carbon-nitrogen hydrolase family protein [Deltaproteobacteria bacterium]MDL1988630.1 carbon-nitrogen hydrolase family protein [Deltaproteobacteria bacterium]